MCGHRTRTPRTYAEREPRDRSVRASDADRDRTTEMLREQAGLGRLDPEELEERLEAALKAKTLADLDALTADLPPAEARRERPRQRTPFVLSPVFLVVVALVTISVIAGHPAFWLFFLLFFVHWRPWPGPRWHGRRASEA